MEYDKINNLLDSESENLSKFVTRDYVRVNTYNTLIRIMKINQLDLKHPFYDWIYVIMQMRIF